MAAALSYDYTTAVVEDGAVYACGRGGYGQLGLDSRQDQLLPARVGGAELHGGSPVVMVAAGRHHRAALTEDGGICTCGDGSKGQLGHGDAQERLGPARLGPEAFGGFPVVLVACGGFHTMAVTGGGHVWTCGENCAGQLGHGDRTERQVFTLVDPGQFGGCSIVAAAGGNRHSVVASAEGDVFTWGSASYGRLGHNCVNGDWLAPAQLGRGQFGGGRIVFVAAGGLHTVAVTEGGVLWVWGDGSCGQLGLGDRDSRLVPTRLGPAIEVLGELGTGEWEEVFWGSLVHVAACGHVHTLVVTEEGAVWVFGRGEHGRLGLNDEDDRLVPTRVGLQRFAGARVATVAAGGDHSAAVTEDGALFTWGTGEAYPAGCQVPGGLGHADLHNRLVPTLVSPGLLSGARVGRWHRLAEELALAFAMGTHARLGDKGCPYLMVPGELVERVLEACMWAGEGPPRPPGMIGRQTWKLGEGVKRLMGGVRARIY